MSMLVHLGWVGGLSNVHVDISSTFLGHFLPGNKKNAEKSFDLSENGH